MTGLVTLTGSTRRGNYRQALDIWMVLAFEGDPQSQFRVGVLFSEGKGVDQDFEQSAYWYTQAARQGHIAAQYNLGHAYYAGAGIQQNDTEALKWWEAAARGGHELAQYNAGRAYYMGIASTKDPQAARFWFSQAAANGEPRSQEILDKLGWEPVAAVHLAPPPEPGSETPAATTSAQPEIVTMRPTEPGSEPLPVSTGLPAPAIENHVVMQDINTNLTDGEPSLDEPVGAPLEQIAPVGEATMEKLPDPAPPQNIVTSTVNWDPQPPATSLSLDNPVGSPLEERIPVGPAVVARPETRPVRTADSGGASHTSNTDRRTRHH